MEQSFQRLSGINFLVGGSLDKSLNDFEIINVEDYHERREMPQPLADTLIPIIKKDELDRISEGFLRVYYPEMLEKPQALNPFRLIERLGLNLSMRHLTAKGDIFGQIYFEDGVGQFYSSDKKQTYLLQVKAGDVFIDPESYALRNLGTVNNTIVHECLHWVKHRKAIAFKRLLNENFEELSCQLTTSNHVSKNDAIDWMEWQASQLAPRIMLPRQMFKQKAEELIRNQREKTGLEELEVLEMVIDTLAEFFGVSRQSAKIRLVDVGFVQAIGTFEYIDGKYIRPYTFKVGTLKKNQTFSIGYQTQRPFLL